MFCNSAALSCSGCTLFSIVRPIINATINATREKAPINGCINITINNNSENGASKIAPEIGDTIKFLNILMFENALDPSLHVSLPCSKVQLKTFSSSLYKRYCSRKKDTFSNPL